MTTGIYKRTKENNRIHSEARKKLFARGYINPFKGKHHTKEDIEKALETKRKNGNWFCSRKGNVKRSKTLKGHITTIETREKIRKKVTGHIVTENTRQKIREKVINYIKSDKFKNKNTKIELKIKKLLDELKISYIHQYSFKDKFVCDFGIPYKKLIIECDGIYWHNRKDTKKKDKAKDIYIQTCGWKILRLNENEIHNNINLCSNKIMENF